ncbi:MAG: protein kinase [Myxococcota bacterium]
MTGAAQFGRFWLHDRIGRGGMADVFRATLGDDPYRFSLEVALKRMHESLVDNPTFVEMFLVEEYVQGLLQHPNIIRMYESGRHHERIPYIVMEYVPGRDLGAMLERMMTRRLRMPLDVAIQITLEILKAIDFAHRATDSDGKALDVIHRDVTPPNIYVGYDGRVKLGDFGVARVNGIEPTSHRKMVKGKLAYLAPETLLGAQPSQRDDLWSLAVCFYEMIASTRFYQDRSEQAIMKQVGSGKIPAPEMPLGASRELRRLTQRLLHPKAKLRPRDAVQFYRELKAFAIRRELRLDRDNVGRFVISVFGDVDVLAANQEAPLRDRLTGAMSDRYVHHYLTSEVDRARRYRRELSVLSFNVDRFSRINRQNGETVGDELLVSIVRRFLPDVARVRSCDTVARRRADHFSIVLPETGLAGAQTLARRLRQCFETHAWSGVVPGFPTRQDDLTVSVGIATLGINGRSATELLRASDQALGGAKRAGGNRVASAPRQKSNESSQRLRPSDPERIELKFTTNESFLRAYADDIAGGGLRVTLPQLLDVDSNVELNLRFADEKDPVCLRATVCWTGRDGMVGLSFPDTNNQIRARVERVSALGFSSDGSSLPATSEHS